MSWNDGDQPERDVFDRRPSADEILARITADQAAPGSRGRLRVYLGMAPGVGKTFRMLEEGHRRVARGTDLVVGFVETHGRSQTAALLEGLEVVARRRVEHRSVTVEEMDAEAIIARAPVVALIDELAHTNAPGSDRLKRWEDIERIRDAGIHVVSTCNVQHVESLADAVELITGAPVHERIPDSVLANADEIELVDMSPHALRQRMRHGNVYREQQVQVALERFFTEENLTSLRELALRLVARRVEDQLDGMASRHREHPVAAVSERVLVLVDGTPAGREAIRRAAALAARVRGDLVALVPEPQAPSLTWEAARDLRAAADYASDLGAVLVRVADVHRAETIARAIRDRGGTFLVVPLRPQRTLGPFGRAPLGDRILQLAPEIDLMVVGPPARAPETP